MRFSRFFKSTRKANRFAMLNRRASRALAVFKTIKDELINTIGQLESLEVESKEEAEKLLEVASQVKAEIERNKETLGRIETIIG